MRKDRKHIKQWYKDLSFKKKLLSIILGVCVFPVFILQIIFTIISIANMNKQINEQIHNNLVQISEKFTLKMESYQDIVYQIYSDKALIQSLEKYPQAGKMERAYLFYSLNERMKQLAESKKGIRTISLICKSGESVTYDSESGSSLDNIWRDYEDLRTIEPYQETAGKNEIVLISTMIIPNQEKTDVLFFMGKELYNANNLEQGVIATLIIGIEEQELNQVCNGAQEHPESSITFITDTNGRVLSFPKQNEVGFVLSEQKDAVDFVLSTNIFHSENLLSSSYQEEQTGWIFYNVYDQNYIMRDVKLFQMIYWFLLIIDAIVVIVFVNSINHYFNNYLNKIMQGIQQVEKGNLDVQLVVDRQDEFGRIGENFNHMTGKVKSLIAEMTEISEKKKQAEIKALESQINPHFLYNTLDAINWMAVRREQYEVSRMINNLGFILRYSMNQSNEQATISEVEEWIKSYVSLYQLRYGYSFEFQIYVEKDVQKKKIYKLLLQPIVENAILHGIKDMEDGLLRVDIALDEPSNRVHIIVEDNGVGMEKKKIDIYNQREREWAGTERIGLANIFERIQLYYGRQGEWHISSVEEMGTIIELLLPLEDMEEIQEKVIE